MAFPRAIDKTKENSARRVIKQGLFYICGMCGSRYGSEGQAEACLKKCINRYMAQNTVQDKPERSGTVYRCAYCKRVYEKLIQAKECAKVCKAEIQRKIDAEARYKKPQSVEEKMKNLAAFAGGEQSVPAARPRPAAEPPPEAKAPPKKTPSANKPVAEAKAKRPPPAEAPAPMPEPVAAPKPVHPAEGTKFEREGHHYKCHTCHQKYSKYQEAIACYDRHREQELAGVTMKKDSDDKFFRDGAKYVCKKCNAKYFSRADVVACYDGHKEEDEVWVTGGPQGKPKAEAVPAVAAESADAPRLRRGTARSEREKFFRDGAKYVCRICNKKLFTKSEVIQCYDGHAAEDEAATPAATPDSGPTLTTQDLENAVGKALADVKPGVNRDGGDKFFRDGAKYVCKKCNSKYFTRNEVIQCFDKH